MSLEGDHWNPNMLIPCPYDDSHRIAASRFQRHILKCRKNHPTKDTVSCPFNATHIILRPNLKAHLGECPDRTAIDPDVIQAQCEETGEIQKLMGNVSIPERIWKSPDDSEDWDKEAEQYEHQKFAKPSAAQSNNFETRKATQTNNHFNNNASTNGNSLYVRLGGRGHKILTDRPTHQANEVRSPGRQIRQPMSSNSGRGRGTILLKTVRS